MYVGAVDAYASLVADPFEVDIAGRTFTVMPRFAVDWLRVLLSPGLEVLDIVPGFLDSDDQLIVDQMMLDGAVEPEELGRCALDLLAETAGHPWWWAIRVLSLATAPQLWPIVHGRLVRDGVQPQSISIGEWLHAVLSILRDIIEPAKFQQLSQQLDMAPEGVEAELDYAAEEDTFLGMMNTPIG